MDIIGKKAVNEDGPSEDDLIDRDLASPQFVSWTARREAGHLRDVVRTLWPHHEQMVEKAQRAFDLIAELDDEIEAISEGG